MAPTPPRNGAAHCLSEQPPPAPGATAGAVAARFWRRPTRPTTRVAPAIPLAAYGAPNRAQRRDWRPKPGQAAQPPPPFLEYRQQARGLKAQPQPAARRLRPVARALAGAVAAQAA